MEAKKKNIEFHRIIYTVITAAFLICVPMLSMSVDPNKYTGGRSKDLGAQEERNRSAIAMMIGQFRASISDMIFVKTEIYLHGGVGYQGSDIHEELSTVAGKNPDAVSYENNNNDHEEKNGHVHENGEAELENEHGHEHEKLDTVIATPEKDFRGFIGNMNREVKPWLDPSKPHYHIGGEELLPWYRLMTLSDPHNVRAYYLGAFWLKRKNPDKAIEFATEGIKNNPKSFQIYQTLGQIYYYKATKVWGSEKLNPSPEARDFIAKAMMHYRRAVELVFEKRPEGGPETSTPDKWNDYEEQDARAAARLYILLEKDYGNPESAKKQAADFAKRFGGDKILESHTR